jgi:hypothetical protein
LQDVQKIFGDCIGILRYVVIPNADDPPTISREPSRSLLVSLARRMLAAVNFNDQTVSDRHEIRDIGSNRALAPKLIPGQSSVAQS